MSTLEVPDVQRVAFFPGQRLTAADLTALERRQRELRWLHNRSLHPWGVASGFSLRYSAPSPAMCGAAIEVPESTP